MSKARIELAAGFERNPDAIAVFLAKAGAPAGVFDDLLNTIVSRLCPLLESHPRAGRDWLLKAPPTQSGRALQGGPRWIGRCHPPRAGVRSSQ